MGFSDIKILCQAYEFTESVEPKDRNFFNPVSTKIPVGTEIDLMDFAISLKPLSYTKVAGDDETNELMFEAGDISVELSSSRYNSFLRDYFLLLDKSGIIARRKYKVVIKYEGTELMSGFINAGNYSGQYTTDIAINKSIEATIISAEKEYAEYINGKNLPPCEDIYLGGDFFVPWWHDNRAEDNHTNLCTGKYLYRIFQQLLGLESDLKGDVGNWIVNNIPQFCNLGNTNNWFVPSGYKRWNQEGLTIYEFIKYMCNAMGWIWKFDMTNNKIVIANRSEFTNPVLSLDHSKVGNMKFSYDAVKGNVRHVLIEAGQMKQRNHGIGTTTESQGGRRFKIISNKSLITGQLNNNQTNYFTYWNVNPGPMYSPVMPDYKRWTTYNGETDKLFKLIETWIWGQQWINKEYEEHVLPKEEIMFIPAGKQNAMKTVCDYNGGRNYPALDVGESIDDLLFSGNVGDCLFQASSTYFITSNYHKYALGYQFHKNFESLLSAAGSNVVEYTINDVIKSPDVVCQVINTIKDEPAVQNFFKDSSFAVNSLETDLINKTSTLLLVRE